MAADVARVEGKLADQAFVSKAPAAVVEKERAKLASLRDEHDALAAQLEELGS